MKTVNAPIPIVEVSLQEDRAHVVRRGRGPLPAGVTRMRIEGIAPVVADKTVSVRIESGAATVGQVRVERREVILDEDLDATLATLERKLDETRRERDRLHAERELTDGHRERLVELELRALAEFAEDATWNRLDQPLWLKQLGSLRDARMECGLALVDAGERIEDLEERLADLRAQINAAGGPQSELRADLLVDLHSEAAGETTLRIDYLVPNACWRPTHAAYLVEGASPTVRLESSACVWQNTGEDWTDVQLYFSTERPSLGTEPPKLATDRVRAHKVGSEVAVDTRDERIHTSGLGGPRTAVAPEVPGIDDGGEPLRLSARAKADVPSDGRPHRVPIFELESSATVERVLRAEVCPMVILRTELTNEAPHPLLAGPVELVRAGGHAGRTKTLFVAPGERFELGWGPDPALRVHRDVRQLDEESRMLSSWTKVRHRVSVRLSNIGAEARTVKVEERIPVSEVEKVEITLEPKETRGPAQPDADGLLRWVLALEPYGRERVDVGYVLARHSDVVGL